VTQWDAIFCFKHPRPFLVSREALPYLRKSRGRIVNMARSAGCGPGRRMRTIARQNGVAHADESDGEGAGADIAVNAVAPE